MTDIGHGRASRAGKVRARLTGPLGLATAVALGLSLAAPQQAVADEIASESFTGTTIDTNKWFSGATGPDDPTGYGCLTAATGEKAPLKACQTPVGDKPGQGALRLTTNKGKQTGFVATKNTFPSRAGMKFTIDFAAYDPTTKDAADGISLMLLDGTAPMPKAGGIYGGGLGYTGIKGGYLGVGLDVFGNFTKQAYGSGGTPKRMPNSITVRGATSVDNPMVATYQSGRKLAVTTAKTRTEAVRTAKIELSPAGKLAVAIDFHDGRGWRDVIEPLDLDDIKGQPKVPETFRLGFAASTGDSTEIHELWNGKLETLDPKLSTTVVPTGPVNAGQDAEFEMTTANDKLAGPTTGEVTTTQTFPEGVTPVSAAGDGWKCEIKGQTVTCKRPDTLKPGEKYPPVKVKTKVAGDAKGDKTVTSQATTPGSGPAVPDTSKFTVTPAKGPDLTVTTKPVGDVVGGQNAGYTIDVADKPTAGPTNGEVKVVRTFPKGITPVSAAGDGWKCAIAGQTVTCTRPGTGADVLNPGKSYPTINIGTRVADDAKGDLTGTTETTTPGQQHPAGPVKDTTTVKPAPVKDPNLTVATKPVGDVVAGKPAKFQVDVDNAKDAGPTRGRTVVTRTFPDGVTPTKASGDGWECVIGGQTVSCQRPDVLKPGGKFPPISIETKVDKDAKGQLEGATDFTTKGDPNSGSKVFDTFVVKENANQDISCGGWVEGLNRAGKPCE
ncbi:lectin-like domain-containing protein [Actinomycetota bacterium Odt1-20B]